MTDSKEWLVSCQDARLHGAIGITYAIKKKIAAETENQAEELFRAEVECWSPVVVRPA